MAKRANAEFTAIPITQARLTADFSDAVWHGETFFANAHGVAKFALSRAVHQAGYKVVLTGEGSDEILAGYPRFRADLALDCTETQRAALQYALASSNTVSRGLLLADGQVPPSSVFLERLGYAPAWVEARQGVLQRLRPVLPTSFRTDELHEQLLGHLNVGSQMSGRHVVNQSLYLWNKTSVPGYILTILGDRMEMSHSVEGRVPFLDHHVVEFTRTLPVEQKIHGITEKFVLREAMKPWLTTAVYERQKHPFLAPPALLKPDEPLHQMVLDTLRGPVLDSIPFLNKKAVPQLLDCIPMLDEGANWSSFLVSLQRNGECHYGRQKSEQASTAWNFPMNRLWKAKEGNASGGNLRTRTWCSRSMASLRKGNMAGENHSPENCGG